jgi:nucleoside 2-deoxyribosyltransferase
LLREGGYIEGESSKGGANYHLTYKAWDYLTGASATSSIKGRAFVAMSFAKEHDDVFRSGIRLGLLDAGYEPVCLKDVPTNGDINDRILSEIRKAEIVVADFTGQKAGVYFEAGFAFALKKEVYWTCQELELGKVHFDINHYQHVAWQTPEDLRKQLAVKIQAISGQGPYRIGANL